MSLQPLKSEKDVFPISEFGLKHSKHPSEFFCKTLTVSDTSAQNGFSVPCRAAEKLFPPLDYTIQPQSKNLLSKICMTIPGHFDINTGGWSGFESSSCIFFVGQPKRHILTTGWSLFVDSKRLRAGDFVLCSHSCNAS